MLVPVGLRNVSKCEYVFGVHISIHSLGAVYAETVHTVLQKAPTVRLGIECGMRELHSFRTVTPVSVSEMS